MNKAGWFFVGGYFMAACIGIIFFIYGLVNINWLLLLSCVLLLGTISQIICMKENTPKVKQNKQTLQGENK
jgi:hypothetical protein